MNTDRIYRTSRALSLGIDASGRLNATASLSRPPEPVSDDDLALLRRFAEGATPDQVAGASSLPAARVAEMAEQLSTSGLLRPVENGNGNGTSGNAPQTTLDKSPSDDSPNDDSYGSFASLFVHHQLLADSARVLPYRAAIMRHSRDRTVLEIGCGSGILSIFAAQAGAKRVIAIEETEITEVAARMFEANGVADRIELIRANSRDVELDQPAELLVHELLGVDPLDEQLLSTLRDARRLLTPDARYLPHRLEVCCLGVELAERSSADRSRLIAEATELAAIYGVDFTPFLDLLQTTPLPVRQPPPQGENDAVFKPRVLSREHKLLDLDLRVDAWPIDDQLAGTALDIANSGMLGGVVIYFRAHLDDHTTLSTAPFAPLTSWGRRLRPLSRKLEVAAGDRVPLIASVDARRDRPGLTLDLR